MFSDMYIVRFCAVLCGSRPMRSKDNRMNANCRVGVNNDRAEIADSVVGGEHTGDELSSLGAVKGN